MLIAIEGVDGAGKRTLVEKLAQVFQAAGMSVATLAFPRYGRSVTADVAAEALHGEHGDLASSVYAMAMLFALDRAAAVGEIEALGRDHDVVILDRYVASNAAYSAARLHEDAAEVLRSWSAVEREAAAGCALEGPAVQKRAALCLNPDGLDPASDVKAAVADAGERLKHAGRVGCRGLRP